MLIGREEIRKGEAMNQKKTKKNLTLKITKRKDQATTRRHLASKLIRKKETLIPVDHELREGKGTP